MELIIISESKLKIMLNADEVKKYDLETGCQGDISGRAAFRNILKEARDKCGFDAVGERVFVQYYPERGGGCEMFITKLGEKRSEKRTNTTEKRSGYIIYSFEKLSDLLDTCRRLKIARYKGESKAWRETSGEKYYLTLEKEILFAAESGGEVCHDGYYYILKEHSHLLCDNAVSKLAPLA